MQEMLSPENESAIAQFLHDGTHPDRAAVLNEAMNLLRKRQELLGELNIGVDQLDAGEYREYDITGLQTRIEEIKSEGKQKLDVGS